MKRNARKERKQAHALLDLLPDEKVAAVRTLLEAMVEPVSKSLTNAEEDTEELAPQTVMAIKRARASLARGEGVPHEEVLREFGVKK